MVISELVSGLFKHPLKLLLLFDMILIPSTITANYPTSRAWLLRGQDPDRSVEKHSSYEVDRLIKHFINKFIVVNFDFIKKR